MPTYASNTSTTADDARDFSIIIFCTYLQFCLYISCLLIERQLRKEAENTTANEAVPAKAKAACWQAIARDNLETVPLSLVVLLAAATADPRFSSYCSGAFFFTRLLYVIFAAGSNNPQLIAVDDKLAIIEWFLWMAGTLTIVFAAGAGTAAASEASTPIFIFGVTIGYHFSFWSAPLIFSLFLIFFKGIFLRKQQKKQDTESGLALAT
jgi:hypothetical protein